MDVLAVQAVGKLVGDRLAQKGRAGIQQGLHRARGRHRRGMAAQPVRVAGPGAAANPPDVEEGTADPGDDSAPVPTTPPVGVGGLGGAGGGGADQLAMMEWYAETVMEAVRQRDFIMYNQRGSPRTEPELACPGIEDLYWELAGDPPFETD